MGFFDKKATCAVCGKEVGLNRFKVKQSDEWVCPDCLKAAGGMARVNLSKVTIEDIRALISESSRQQEVYPEQPKESAEGSNGKAISLQNAEGMYEYCLQNKFGSGMTKAWGIKHFQVVEGNLMPGEKVYMAFMGLHNYVSAQKHDGNFAYVITNKRIMMGQKKAIGQVFQTVKIENINDVTFKSSLLMGVLTIDTYKETFNVGLDKYSAQNINKKVHEIIEQIKNDAAPVAAPAQAPISAADEIKKFKGLLDIGAITQEEFDAKKKQLLGL